MKTARLAIAAIVATLTLMIGMQGSLMGVGAQATPSAEGEGVVRPAHIHEGSCPEIGAVVFPLDELIPTMGSTSLEEAASPMASPSSDMGMSGMAVAESTTEVDATLDDILAAEHAINVHESAENISNYIACGDVTGTATNGELHIQLQELNGSGFMGEAHLVDNGDGTTTVTVTIMVSANDGATPEATPSS